MKDNQILRTCIAVESEEDVLKWDRRLKEVSDCDDEYLLLPKSYTYSKKAVCGSSGIVEVHLPVSLDRLRQLSVPAPRGNREPAAEPQPLHLDRDVVLGLRLGFLRLHIQEHRQQGR